MHEVPFLTQLEHVGRAPSQRDFFWRHSWHAWIVRLGSGMGREGDVCVLGDASWRVLGACSTALDTCRASQIKVGNKVVTLGVLAFCREGRSWWAPGYELEASPSVSGVTRGMSWGRCSVT